MPMQKVVEVLGLAQYLMQVFSEANLIVREGYLRENAEDLIPEERWVFCSDRPLPRLTILNKIFQYFQGKYQPEPCFDNDGFYLISRDDRLVCATIRADCQFWQFEKCLVTVSITPQRPPIAYKIPRYFHPAHL